MRKERIKMDESCLYKIQKAGVIGCGGAGFPTHVKLNCHPEYLIVNGMECEPLLATGRYVMRHYAPELIDALYKIGSEIGAEECIISLKETYEPEIAALEEAIAASGHEIGIKTVKSFYPAGDEQVVVYETTGNVVPYLDIPISAKSVVINLSTLLACYNAFLDEPFTHRLVTVAGAVKEPCVVYAPIGTSFCDCIALAGGPDRDMSELTIVSGGPMMGQLPGDDPKQMFVEKTTGGILLLPKETYKNEPLDLANIRKSARTSCIQCTNCTEMCPRHMLGHPLEPHKIMRVLAYNELADVMDNPVIQSAALCSECGVCEVYACPMMLRPRSVNALIKKELAKAGYRHPKAAEPTVPHPMREDRKVPTHRLATRVGVGAFFGNLIDTLKIAEPDTVHVLAKQGIGAPTELRVKAGDVVSAGQLIAACPEGKMGSDVHAPFGGKVTEAGKYIVIER